MFVLPVSSASPSPPYFRQRYLLLHLLLILSTFLSIQIYAWSPIQQNHHHKSYPMLMTRLSSRVARSLLGSRASNRSSYSRVRDTRLFGTKAGVPGNPPGTISIYNEQTTLPDIDQEALKGTVHRISQLLGYETYDVTLLLVEDEEMRATNLESRGIDKPTDILSFPFHEHDTPGVLKEPEFDIPDYYHLGDMVVDIPYVMRRCQEDQEELENSSSSDDEDEVERGVSGAMATVFDTEYRVHMLLVHGMLHLVGHDHEEDEEYELMVTREEEILKELGLIKQISNN